MSPKKDQTAFIDAGNESGVEIKKSKKLHPRLAKPAKIIETSMVALQLPKKLLTEIDRYRYDEIYHQKSRKTFIIDAILQHIDRLKKKMSYDEDLS